MPKPANLLSLQTIRQVYVQLQRRLQTNQTQQINDVVIVSAVRTPICKFQGELATFTAPRLGALAIDAAVKRAAIGHESVNDLYMGHALSAGVGQAPARQAAALAQLPNNVCCTTVNKVCASGMKAIIMAAQALQLGQAEVAVAGGMESMSNVPFYLQRGAIPYGGTELRDGIIYDALSDYSSRIALTQYAYMEAQRLIICQAELDTYYKISKQRALEATVAGAFMEEIVPIYIQNSHRKSLVQLDEELQEPHKTADEHGGSAISALNDGAAALVLTTLPKARELKLVPLARILGYQDVETAPTDFAIAPALAVDRLLKRLNISLDSIKRFEINDDVAILPLAFMKHLQLTPDCVNMEGGALALGHPIGMSGARMVTHLAHSLVREGDMGCAAVSDGDGGASVMLIEKMQSSYYRDYARPVLTLYTKPDCSLCDEMVEELKGNFGAEYLLEKINIAEKHNLRLFRLYRYDIPVLFFNGHFLCMHRLNHKLLRRKIDLFKLYRI